MASLYSLAQDLNVPIRKGQNPILLTGHRMNKILFIFTMG